jgi:hypothetical protein
MLSAIALSTFALVKMSGSAAYPGRLYPGALCLTCDKGGSDCNFTSYAEYLEAESGIGAVCFDRSGRRKVSNSAIINMNREPNATAAGSF